MTPNFNYWYKVGNRGYLNMTGKTKDWVLRFYDQYGEQIRKLRSACNDSTDALMSFLYRADIGERVIKMNSGFKPKYKERDVAS